MKVITMYLLILALIVRTESLNAKLEDKSIKSLFKKAKHKIPEEYRYKKAEFHASRKAYKEAEKHRKKIFRDEMSKIKREELMDQGYGKGDLEVGKKYNMVGSSDLHRSPHHTHKVEDNDLKALQLELEKKVVEDIDHFVQKVGAY